MNKMGCGAPPLFLVLVLMNFGLVMSGGIASIGCAASNKPLSAIARAHLNTLISAGLNHQMFGVLNCAFLAYAIMDQEAS